MSSWDSRATGTTTEPDRGLEFFGHMAWGAARHLIGSMPQVVAGRQIAHNVGLVATAISQAVGGDWALAGNTIAEHQYHESWS